MIKIRKAKLGDEIGISKMVKAGLNKNTWAYTGTNKYTKKKLENLRRSSSHKVPFFFFIASFYKH